MAVYAAGHFLVDMICAFCLLSLPVMRGDGWLVFLLYNFCAFACQMPMGLIADRLNRNSAVAAMGLVWTTVAFLCIPYPSLCAVCLGLGNGLYHVGGGVEVLSFDDRRQWMLGVFVSPGALGLFVGTLAAASPRVSVTVAGVLASVLSVAVILLLHMTVPLHRSSGNPPLSVRPWRGERRPSPSAAIFADSSPTAAPVSRPALAVAILCLFSVVILRSYVGMTLHTPWKSETALSVLAVASLAGGKAAGGFLADRFGATGTALVSLSLCSVLFLFSENPACGLLAIFLFNMTMPLTLFAMAALFPGARGFAFGTLTFALFLGSLPTLLGLPIPFFAQTWFSALEAALSLGLLLVGLTAGRGRRARRE